MTWLLLAPQREGVMGLAWGMWKLEPVTTAVTAWGPLLGLHCQHASPQEEWGPFAVQFSSSV